MASQKVEVASSGSGFAGVLTIAFIVLKLTGYIDWSWWAVTSPLWAPAALVVTVLVIVFLLAVMFASYKDWRAKQRANKRQGK